RAALAHHFDRPLPSLRLADCFDDHVASALLWRECADCLNYIRDFGCLNNFMSAHMLGGRDLLVAFHDGNHVAADSASDLDEHQSDGAAAENCHGVTDFHLGFMQSAKHTGERLSHGGIFEADIRRDDQHVGLNDAARHAYVFSVCPV